MAKNLQDLIPIAPGSFSEEGRSDNVWWFSNNTMTPNTTHITNHGSAADGGGQKAIWKVPAGTTEINFHAWGGGGSGAPGYCCTQGIDGGSGSWVTKTLKTGFTPGSSRYIICLTANGTAGSRNCVSSAASKQSPQYNVDGGGTGLGTAPGTNGDWDVTNNDLFDTLCGCRGPDVSIVGPGLTNFCAEGGNGGLSLYKMLYNLNTRCIARTGGPEAGLGVLNCCNQTFRMCDLRGQETDSDAGFFRRARYYGGDDGAKGVYACYQLGCCGCWQVEQCHMAGDRKWQAISGAKWWEGSASVKYGQTFSSQYMSCTNNTWGNFGPHGTAERQQSLGPIGGGKYNYDNGGGPIGWGGLTAFTCGGTCCCGGYGGSGLTVITYKQDLTWQRT